MIPASSLVVMWTRDMVAMVAFLYCINAFSGCIWFEASDTDGSVLKRNVYVWPRLHGATRSRSAPGELHPHSPLCYAPDSYKGVPTCRCEESTAEGCLAWGSSIMWRHDYVTYRPHDEFVAIREEWTQSNGKALFLSCRESFVLFSLWLPQGDA